MAAENSVLGFETPQINLYFNVDRRRVLFSDTFYTAFPAIEIATNRHFICKNYPKKILKATYGIEDLRREIEVLYHLYGQPNIAQIYQVYESSTDVDIILDLHECSDPSHIPVRLILRRCYREHEASMLITMILRVIQACDNLGIICRNLSHKTFCFAKKDGLLLGATAVDFAHATFLKPGPRLRGLAGSRVYRAPEMLDWYYGSKVDVWAAGIILYRLLGGVPPFHNVDDTDDDTYGVTNDDKGKDYEQINFHSKPWDSISEDAKDLITKMLDYFPNNRVKPLDALRHRWLNVDGDHPTLAVETILYRLDRFSAMNKLKKMALWVIVDRLQRVEIAGLEACFQVINASNNGEITIWELQDSLEKDRFSRPSFNLQAIMDAADLNENGTIDSREFIAGTLPYSKLETLELWPSAFEYFAEESSGYITLEKLQQTCPNTSHVLLKDIIKEVGREKDGCISYSEFVDMMQEF